MSTKRVVVWVQPFSDRANLMLQWHDPHTGKRRSRSAGTDNVALAETKRADLEYELNNGQFKDPSRMSWETFRELFEAEHVASKRKPTRDNYKATLDIFERLGKPTALRTITERTISTFAAAMRREPGRSAGTSMQASSIKTHLRFLRTALRWAVDQKFLPECPKFPKTKVPKRRPQPVPTEAFERILAAAAGDPHLQAYILCGWLAGLRRNEAIELRWQESERFPWLDLGRDRIVFPAGFVKADEDQWVPLDPALRAALEALPRDHETVFLFRGKSGKRVGEGAVSNRVVALARKAGVKLSMRVLRRGFGCRYAGKVPAQVLQKLMRHSSIAVTVEYYSNVDEAATEAVMGKPAQRNSPPDSRPPAANEQTQQTDR